jgi:hypothetical protein
MEGSQKSRVERCPCGYQGKIKMNIFQKLNTPITVPKWKYALLWLLVFMTAVTHMFKK